MVGYCYSVYIYIIHLSLMEVSTTEYSGTISESYYSYGGEGGRGGCVIEGMSVSLILIVVVVELKSFEKGQSAAASRYPTG